jgi:hypothetical protein
MENHVAAVALAVFDRLMEGVGDARTLARDLRTDPAPWLSDPAGFSSAYIKGSSSARTQDETTCEAKPRVLR